MNWEIGIDIYTLVYIKQITNENLEVGNGNPPQYSCLKNSMDRGASWATVHGVTVRYY